LTKGNDLKKALVGLTGAGLLSLAIGLATDRSKPAEEATSAGAVPSVDSISLPALASLEGNGGDLKPGRVLDRNKAYTRYYITYRSGELTISGIMNVPSGRGPFPVLILNHGFIPPRIYTNGRGLKREQDYLARKNFVVIHPDYRNHAESDKDTLNDLKLRLGYTEDVINIVDAVRRSELPYFDKDRIGMMGHSMGGGIAMNIMVTRPELVKAVVLYAPVSADAADNFYRWTANSEAGRKILDRYGSPASAPDFWKNLSAMSFLDRATAPVLIHHGMRDESCPLEWSERLRDSLSVRGKAVTLHAYEGEKHELIDRWPLMMQRTTDFFNRHLRSKP
jgi:dipeptidyl aminopeptidase/acylaminoacyl peptidase